jgi:hypothetical protein
MCGLSHRWQWQESIGQRDTLSHIKDLLNWGCLGKRGKLLLR